MDGGGERSGLNLQLSRTAVQKGGEREEKGETLIYVTKAVLKKFEKKGKKALLSILCQTHPASGERQEGPDLFSRTRGT